MVSNFFRVITHTGSCKTNLLAILLLSLIVITTLPSVEGYEIHISSNPSTVPSGKVGHPYSVAFYTDSSYPGFIYWKVEGAIPPGLHIVPAAGTGGWRRAPTLTMSGNPSTAGTFNIKVIAKEDAPDVPFFDEKTHTIIINPSTTTTPPGGVPQPIDYYLSVLPARLIFDLSPLATGHATTVKGYSRIVLRKIGGDPEAIMLKESNLPSGVDMYVGSSFVRGEDSTHIIMDGIWLDTIVGYEIMISVGSNWRNLAGPNGQTKIYTVVFQGISSPSSISREATLSLEFFYGLPRLEILNIEPITQHGSTLIINKQTMFKFDYTLEQTSEVTADVYLRLPKSRWDTTLDVYTEDDQDYVFREWITFNSTSGGWPNTAYLMEGLTGRQGQFFPSPKYKVREDAPESERTRVSIEIDPYSSIEWDEQSVLSNTTYLTAQYTCPLSPEYIKIITLSPTIGGYQYAFLSGELDELNEELFEGPRREGRAGRQQRDYPYPYEIYLSGIFPVNFIHNRHPILYSGYGWHIGWRDADNIAEGAADEGYSRVVAIVPDGTIQEEVGGGTIGVVYNAAYFFWDQGYHTAFVEYTHAVDPGRYMYFPVTAHELSHTYKYPDIYDGYEVVVPVECVFFDEIQGGIIRIFKDEFAGGSRMVGTTGVFKPKWWKAQPLPVYPGARGNHSARDIMDHSGSDRDHYWSWASWENVHYYGGGEDPPESLLISMIVCKNGTVFERPFQKLYNQTLRYPQTEGEGNFSLILYDKSGEVFRNYPCIISFYKSVDPGGYVPTEALPLLTAVEWNDSLGRIELVDIDGKVWFRRDVSENTPVIDVIFPPEGKMLEINRDYNVAWKGTDADGDQLWYTVLIQKDGDEVWKSLASRIQENNLSFTPSDEFESGNYLLQVKATDGVNTAVKVVHLSMAKEIRKYTLIVNTNIDLKINGSGTYDEGDEVDLEAPKEVPMEGLWGLPVGKYRFNYWKGAIDYKEPKVVVKIGGEKTDLKMTAFYASDYSEVYLIMGVIIAIIMLIAFSVIILSKRRPRTPK